MQKQCNVIPYSLAPKFLPDSNCAAVVASANRNPPSRYSCPSVSQPAVVRDMLFFWLHVLHGATYAKQKLLIPCCALKRQLGRECKKNCTFQARAIFSSPAWVKSSLRCPAPNLVTLRFGKPKPILCWRWGCLFVYVLSSSLRFSSAVY